jgi:hypothetical protein
MKDGRILGQARGQGILIDQVLIHEQLGISKEGVIDAANATFEEAKTTLIKIVRLHAFVENEQWNVMCMKEEFHARFAMLYFANSISKGEVISTTELLLLLTYLIWGNLLISVL